MAMETKTQTGTDMKTHLDHLKNHIKYPANRAALITACNNMSDASETDRRWFQSNIPEGNYKGPIDVLNALLAKV